jgi:sulfur-carrier protein
MNVPILLFAGAKDAVGKNQVEIELPVPTTVLALKTKITEAYPALQAYVQYGRIACGSEFVDDQFALTVDTAKKEIALIPPVSGG